MVKLEAVVLFTQRAGTVYVPGTLDTENLRVFYILNIM